MPKFNFSEGGDINDLKCLAPGDLELKPTFSLLGSLILVTGFALGQQGQEAKQPPSSSPVSVAPWILHSKLIHEVIPEYPKTARDSKVQGDVWIYVMVDEDGNLQSAQLPDCTNCSFDLGEAALAAVKQWKYQPILVDGKPVVATSYVVFRFWLAFAPTVQIVTNSEKTTPSAEALRGVGPLRLNISSGVAEAHVVHRVEPVYPTDAKIARIQGNVVIQIVIDRHGKVTQLKAVSGHPLLIDSALHAVKQWQYMPYTVNREPVEIESTVNIRFHL